MRYKINNQKNRKLANSLGFVHHFLILSIVVVAVIAAVGYEVYHESDTSKTLAFQGVLIKNQCSSTSSNCSNLLLRQGSKVYSLLLKAHGLSSIPAPGNTVTVMGTSSSSGTISVNNITAQKSGASSTSVATTDPTLPSSTSGSSSSSTNLPRSIGFPLYVTDNFARLPQPNETRTDYVGIGQQLDLTLTTNKTADPWTLYPIVDYASLGLLSGPTVNNTSSSSTITATYMGVSSGVTKLSAMAPTCTAGFYDCKAEYFQDTVTVEPDVVINETNNGQQINISPNELVVVDFSEPWNFKNEPIATRGAMKMVDGPNTIPVQCANSTCDLYDATFMPVRGLDGLTEGGTINATQGYTSMISGIYHVTNTFSVNVNVVSN